MLGAVFAVELLRAGRRGRGRGLRWLYAGWLALWFVSDYNVYHDAVGARLRSGDREWHVRGEVMNLIPLRNRRNEMVTRISEGITRWTLDDGNPLA